MRRTMNDSPRSRTRTLPMDAGRAPVELSTLAALGLAVLTLIVVLATRVASAEPASPGAALSDLAVPAAVSLDGARNLDELLIVPPRRETRTAAEQADDSIALAVARGTRGVVEKPSAFRKRTSDLFRTERPVEIGEQEMLLRLRLRAKSRETMSVELHF